MAGDKPRRPSGLGVDGRRLWSAVVGVYELRADEVHVLELAARTADDVAAVQAALAGAPLTVAGSMGQVREHPLLSELRQQRAALARLLRQLDLPDEAGPASRSHLGRQLPRARWGA